MKKEGFTLVELLAVIAILAILVVIVIPNVIQMFTASKKKVFVADSQTIYKTAENYIMRESLKDITITVTGTFSNAGCGTDLNMPSVTLDYYIRVDKNNIVEFRTRNKEYFLDLDSTKLLLDNINDSVVTKYNAENICP